MPRSRQDTELLVRRVTRRWGGKHRWFCLYCGRKATQVDHFYPESAGGSSKPMNLLPVCGPCNQNKRDREPLEWLKAVGIPEKRRKWLWRVTQDPNFRTLLEPPPQVWELDYRAGRAVSSPKRPPEAPKGHEKGKRA